MKEIQGKIKFLSMPCFNHEIYGRQCHRFALSEQEGDEISKIRTKENSFYLSEITEEQASGFVWEMDDIGFYEYLPPHMIKPASINWQFRLKTAKESLISLLKANDVWIKEWREKPKYEDYNRHCYYAEFIADKEAYNKLPDDLLLIKLQ